MAALGYTSAEALNLLSLDGRYHFIRRVFVSFDESSYGGLGGMRQEEGELAWSERMQAAARGGGARKSRWLGARKGSGEE